MGWSITETIRISITDNNLRNMVYGIFEDYIDSSEINDFYNYIDKTNNERKEEIKRSLLNIDLFEYNNFDYKELHYISTFFTCFSDKQKVNILNSSLIKILTNIEELNNCSNNCIELVATINLSENSIDKNEFNNLSDRVKAIFMKVQLQNSENRKFKL